MPFKDALGLLVESVKGGIGAILVDSEGEAVDAFTHGDQYEIRLAGAHHVIVMNLLRDAVKRMNEADMLKGLSIKSEKIAYTVMPVEEGLFVILMQDDTGTLSQGRKALKDTIPDIVALI